MISKQGIPAETAPNRGNEASSFLEYIIKNYDNLREITIFVHGHQSAWHHKKNMDESLLHLDIGEHSYCNINDFYKTELALPNEFDYAKKLIPELFSILGFSFGENDVQNINFRNCAQFYVNKESIMQHSKETYTKLYDWLMTTPHTSFYTGRMFEYLWHVIFTRSLDDVNLQTYREEVKQHIMSSL